MGVSMIVLERPYDTEVYSIEETNVEINVTGSFHIEVFLNNCLTMTHVTVHHINNNFLFIFCKDKFREQKQTKHNNYW